MFAFHIPRHMTKWRPTSCSRGLTKSSPQTRRLQSQQAGPRTHIFSPFREIDLGRSDNQKSPSPSFQSLIRGSEIRKPEVEAKSEPLALTLEQFAKSSPITLRDACQCAACVDPSSHQREFSFADIPKTIQVASTEYVEATNEWAVTWKNDITGYQDHVSRYPQSVIDQLICNIPVGLDSSRTISLWDRETFANETQEITYDGLLDSDRTLASALELISRHGLVFISDVPKDETAVMKLVTRLTGLYRNTFYGQTWDVRSVPQAKNVAYTSKVLDFHMDLLYMNEPPGLQLLHCLENSCTGGESEFVDTYKAVDRLHSQKPAVTRVLERTAIRYGYNNPPHFYSNTKPVLHWSKKEHKRHAPESIYLHAENPERMKNLGAVYWSPPFVNTIAGIEHRESVKGKVLSEREVLHMTSAFAKMLRSPDLVYETKLPAGTCAVFDNLRVVHARKAFDVNSGKRWLKGAYGDRQDLQSMTRHHVWGKRPPDAA